MGCDYSAMLIVGIDADEAIERDYEETQVKKYNEDTGEPCIKITRRGFNTLFDKEVDEIQTAVENLGLEYIYVNENEKYIGKLLSDTGSNRNNYCTNFNYLSDIASAYADVEETLVTNGYKGPVYVINALSVSC
jgi:hypothetical protein